ncbi:CAP domain-containing protein [Acaricomes phytoseiuli]|uniref:CAP domain-containing protein n=2 Tax=Acaricomes phytoseiuli TaxID=291968 RepID=UPI0009FE43FF|nr:CAP domain-containing protein [Acaricomes phytoseiuli]MCW1249471.1 CAP domain-containing protein [Acaricomes phytoseiuli]
MFDKQSINFIVGSNFMKNYRPVFNYALAPLLVVALIGSGGAVASAASSTNGSSVGTEHQVVGKEILNRDEAGQFESLLDETRRLAGKQPLRVNEFLARVAQHYAQRMASGDAAYVHNPYYSKQIPAGWSRCGENIVKRGNKDIPAMHQSWVDSPGHYGNMIGDYTDVGIGFATSSSGEAFAVQVFAKYK